MGPINLWRLSASYLALAMLVFFLEYGLLLALDGLLSRPRQSEWLAASEYSIGTVVIVAALHLRTKKGPRKKP